MESEPGVKFGLGYVEESLEFLGRLLVALKGRIDQRKLHHFVKDLSDVPHLVLHHLYVGVPAVET